MDTVLFQNKYRVKTTRLKGWNYATDGLYFVTICTFNRMCIFGKIENGQMQLNNFGKIVSDEWLKTPKIRQNVELDAFVVMPNHFHGVIRIKNSRRDTARRVSTLRQFGKPVPGSVPTIIRAFKSAVTKHINRSRNTPSAYVWQRNYHDHIIRNEKSLNEIREYIRNNPLKWEFDRNNPKNTNTVETRRAVPLHYNNFINQGG